MNTKNETILQDSSFYTRRYILSECMDWNDCIFLRSDGSKASAWKKAAQTKIRINTDSWELEIKVPKDLAFSNIWGKDKDFKWGKSQIQNVTREETKDTDNKIPYVQVTFTKGSPLAVSSHLEFVNLFFSGIAYFLEKDQILTNFPFVEEKKQEFEKMIENMKHFLTGQATDNIPALPPLPPDTNFVEPLPVHPT